MNFLISDLRYALRQLLKTPGLALLAISTLALGIGANTAIFTIIQDVILRPLPYPHSERLIIAAPKADKPDFGSTSWLNYQDIRNQSSMLDAVGSYSEDVSVVETAAGSISVAAPRVTPNLFFVMGAKPILGRTFTEEEGLTDGTNVAILTEGIWRSAFHADRDIVGKIIKAGGVSRTIVGVLPKSFQFPDSVGADGMHNAIWLPLQPTSQMLKDRTYDFLNVIGELRPGVTAKQYDQELDGIVSRIPREKGEPSLVFEAYSFQALITGPVRPVLLALLAALGLVLLTACANVSNLLIARCLARRQEFAVRIALGAGRWTIIRQILSESVILSVLGCVIGLILAQLSILAIRKLPEGTIPRADAIFIDWTVLLILGGITIVAMVLTSMLPAILVARGNPQAALQAASRGIGSRTVSGHLSGALVIVEVTLSTVLIIGTALLFHTLWNLEKASLGIDTEHVTTFAVMPADAAGISTMIVSSDATNAPTSVATLVYAPMLERMRTLPGVQDVALVSIRPLTITGLQISFDILGQPVNPLAMTRVSAATSGYGRALGTPVVAGRMIADSDTKSTQPVCVVSETFAKTYFPGANPPQSAVGKQINLDGAETGLVQPLTIIGVLADQVGKTIDGKVLPNLLLPPEQIPTNTLFYPFLLKTAVTFVVKTRGDIPIADQIREMFRHYAPGYALDQFVTMQQAVEKSTFKNRLSLYLVGSFAGLTVAMAVAGLYGVLLQAVNFRRREIGVRTALGATRGDIAWMILRRGAILVGIGLGVGLTIALSTTHLLASFFYQVRSIDPWAYAGVIFSTALVGLIASLIPAYKASCIPPTQALRED